MKIKKLLFTAAIIITAALMLTLGASATGFIRGDFNSDGKLDSDDAVYLLYHLYFSEKYPVCQPADVNGDGVINTDDVVFLLYSYLLPEEYPFPECITHTIVVVPGVESTCVESGNTEGSYCGDCGAIISEAEIIPLISHKYSEVVEVVAPTCCNDGYSLILCSVCNNRFKADIVLSEGHSFSEPQVIKEPTCTENGIYEQTCSVCKETITSETVADGHSYEVNETGDPVCVLCSHTVTADEQLSDEKTILRDCPSDFAFTVETDKGEKYIFENLIIYNIALGKDDPDSTIPFNIINLGNGKYEILPKADYSEGTTYAAEASGDIIITEADDSSLEFKIDSKDRSFSQYNKDLIFIPLPDVESSERNGYIVAPVIEKELLYLTVPDSRTITPEYVGKLICTGSYSSTEELNSDPSRECYFGKVEEIYFSENGECTLTLSCPTLGEIYENLDFSDSYAIDFDILDLEDALAENAIEAMYESESFAEFLATVQTAGDMYAEEKQFYAASIFDSFSITPSVITSGKTAMVKLVGSISIDLKDSNGKKQGVIEVNFNTSTSLSFEANADYSVRWFKVRNFDFNVVQKTDFTFDFGLEIKLNEYKTKPDSKKLYLTSFGKVHVESCPMISSKDKDKLTSLSTEDLMEIFAFKKGYIEDECHLCNPYTHYLDRTVFAVNEATGTVHRFSCGTADRLAAEVTANSIPSGKRNCSSCSPQKIEEHSFAEHMLNSLEYNDWNSSLSSVKNYLNNSPVKDKQTNTKELKEFKFYLGKIVVGVQLNLVFEIYFEGTVDYSYSVSTTNIYGLRLEDGKLKAYNSSDKKDNTSSFDLTGKISTSVCLETYVYLSVTGLEWLVNAGIAIDLGAYADLSGIIHIPYYAEDEKLYTAAYFEAGLFTNLSFKYNIGVWDGKISLIGGKKKLPLIKVGYDKVYYDYYGENNEIDVHGTSVDLDDYDLLKVKYYNAKTNSGGNDMLSLDGKYGLYSVDIALLDTLGNPSSYGTISNGVITLSKDAPCDTTIVARISVEGNSKTITTFKDFFANQYSLGNVKYDLEDIYVTLRFSNHKYSEWQTTIEPTCTEDGLKQSFPLCECTEIFDMVLPALGHEKAVVNAVAATCTSDGHTAETYCSRCSEIFIVRKILPAFGHKYAVDYTCIDRPCQNIGCTYISVASTPHNYSDWAEVPASGCALEAYQLRFCFDCSKIETDPADAYGSDHAHKPENVRYAEYIPPTCTEDGHYVLVCVACNVELLRESVPAIKEHNIGKNVPYVYDDESGHYKICAYDCGYKTEVTAHVFKNACDTSCEHCGYTKDPSAIKHKWEGMKDEDHHWDECSVCGVLKGEKEAHCGGVATCTNDGICSVCGYHYLDKLGHDLGEYVCTETHHYKVCQNDGCSYTAKRGVHKKPENAYPCFGDVKCTVCDYVITPFNGGCVADTEHGLIQDSINSVHYYRCVNGCPSQIDAESCYGGENACYTRNVCEKCGNKYGPYIDHLLEKDDNGYDKYYHDSENHWKICTRENCNVADKRILVGEHQPSHLDPKCTDAVKCKVCDLQLKEKGEHEWCETPVYQATLDKHMYVCGKCSVKRFESCRGGEANCTTPAICDLCGSYYGTALGHSPVGDTYFKNEMFHWQLCLRSNCPSPNGVFNLETHTPDAKANSCVEDVTCTVCGYICEKSKGGHDWDEYEKHDNDSHRRECKVCHTVEYTDCTGGDDICGEKNTCEVCGNKYGAPVEHNVGNGEYLYDNAGHWQICIRENCPAENDRVSYGAHEPDPSKNPCMEEIYCSVCGYLCSQPTGSHIWGSYESTSESTHTRSCIACGITETSDCHGGSDVCGQRNACSDCHSEYGEPIEHELANDGGYASDNTGHWQICLRESCPVEAGNISYGVHLPDPSKNSCIEDITCMVCGYICEQSKGEHRLSDGCIGEEDKSVHKRECKDCHLLIDESCYGGDNVCGKKNICEGCGHEYGEVVEHLANNDHSFDDTTHFSICIRPTCPEPDGVFDREEHIYDDSLPVCEIDKICTVCGYFSESAPGHSPAEIPVCGTGSNSAYHFYVCTNEGCDYPGQREEHVFDRAVEAPEYLCANASCSHGAIYYYSCICGKSAGDNNSLVDTDDRFTVGVGLDHNYIYSPDSDGTHHWTYKCSMCGDILDKEEHYGGENTCTEKAVCEFCGEKYGTTLPHSYIYAIEDEKYAVRETVGGEVVVKTVSCERDGEYWYSCICGKSGGSEEDENLRPGTFTVEAYGHDPSGEIIPVYFNGKGCHYQRCLICDDVDWSVEDHFGGSNVCGQKNACDACGVLYGEKIEHLPDIEGYHVEADRHYKVCLRANCSCDNNLYEVGVHRYNAAPYCTKDRVCTVCGYLAEYAQGHSLELTGDEEGHRYVCVAPGCDYKEEVLPHNYGEPVFSPDLDEHICRYSYTCSDCGYVHYEEVDHRYPETEITLVKEDIYVEEEGVTVYLIRICKECLSCGHLLEIGQSSDHAHSAIRLSDHIYPGCTVPGHTAGAFCAVEGCGFVYVPEEDIEPLGHDYVNGICRRCGETEPTYSKGLEFTLSSDGSYYIVSGIGTCTDLDIRIPPTYEGKPVKEVGDRAFMDCTSLTSIDIPDGITYIGWEAFSGCSSLTSIDIPDGVMSISDRAFYGCSSLTSIDIPDGVTYIGNSAFSYCISLTSINIPYGITNISDWTFHNCRNLKTINIPDEVRSIGDCAFSSCPNLTTVNISDKSMLNNIGHSAFFECYVLTSINIPERVTNIGNYVFSGCSGLTKVNISHKSMLVTIGSNAFHGCSNLESFDIPDGVTNIGNDTFYMCSSLTSIYIPNEVTFIGDGAFCGCSNLTSINIPDRVTYIGNDAFSGCSNLTSINIPDRVTYIGVGAFSDCSSLTSIDIPDGVTRIGDRAFYGCSSLTSIDIPDGVTRIGNHAFHFCSSLTNINIPDRVIYIGDCAFYSCWRLTNINIPNKVAHIGEQAFFGCSSLTIINIPDGITYIGASTFAGCEGLLEINISDAVTRLGENVFHGCSNLTNVNISKNSNLINIGEYAFYGCHSLTSIDIPDWVKSIGCSAFYGCVKLNSISFPDNLMFIGKEAFKNSGVTSATFNATYRWKYYSDNLDPNGILVSAETLNAPIQAAENLTESLSSYYLIRNAGGNTVGSQGLEYDYTGTGLSVVGIGSCTDNDIVIPESYNDIPITSIGEQAFIGCSSLTSIDIPDGVTFIGDYAFYDCSSLVSIDIPDGVTHIGDSAFTWCSSLTSIDIPDEVTFIGDGAFCGCSNLTSIDLPDRVTYIGNDAFSGCSNLTSINIPDGIAFIGDRVFSWCSSLTSLYIPDEVTFIGDGAFSSCSNLISINIPDGVTFIGNRAFEGCSNLSSISVPDELTFIGDEIFRNCSSLTNVDIPNGVTYIGNRAFKDCSNLTNIVIPDGVTFISDEAFQFCKSLKSIDIPDGVTFIGNRAFEGCSNLSSISVPDELTFIGDEIFRNCSSLTNVDIPNGVTYIGNGAFYGCSSLTRINLPHKVTCIGWATFTGCYTLESALFGSPDGWLVLNINKALDPSDLSNPAKAAEYLRSTYHEYYWYRS